MLGSAGKIAIHALVRHSCPLCHAAALATMTRTFGDACELHLQGTRAGEFFEACRLPPVERADQM
jgi:hypothetical protein